MLRTLGCTFVLLLAASSPALAKEWAQKMFTVRSHEFGHVARGSKTEFAFELQNSYEEDVHIAAVRSSCGCTTPTITKPVLKTWEKGTVVAAFNTKSFSGQKSATITVVIDKPYYAEVQLTVAGYIHNDVDVQPGSINFGEVAAGATMEQSVNVTYRGRNAWAIADVQSANENLEVELSDVVHQPGAISYNMLVRLKASAAVGPILDELTIVTNDPTMPNVPITVEGLVAPPLTISPAALFVGTVAAGDTVTKQLVVRAKQPFKITNIHCDDEAFNFKVSDGARTVHLVPVTFTAGVAPGEIEHSIEITTDLPTGGTATCIVRGTIKNGGQISLKPVSR